jgi:hypothetical protein
VIDEQKRDLGEGLKCMFCIIRGGRRPNRLQSAEERSNFLGLLLATSANNLPINTMFFWHSLTEQTYRILHDSDQKKIVKLS